MEVYFIAMKWFQNKPLGTESFLLTALVNETGDNKRNITSIKRDNMRDHSLSENDFFPFFRNANIVDNMIRMMEDYTNQLENLVDERTMQLAEEKAKTDELLYKMLPK